MTEMTEGALKAFLGANVLISLFFAGALQYLWGMINALQVIVLTKLFSLDNIPPNAYIVMQTILKLCALEFIDTGFLSEKLFNFRET